MLKAYRKFWLSYADFKGLSSVKDYWLAFLANFIVNLILQLLLSAANNVAGSIALSCLFIVPGMALCIRRLRDAGHKWTYVFMSLIPVAGPIVLIVALCSQSKDPAATAAYDEKRELIYSEKYPCGFAAAAAILFGFLGLEGLYSDISLLAGGLAARLGAIYMISGLLCDIGLLGIAVSLLLKKERIPVSVFCLLCAAGTILSRNFFQPVVYVLAAVLLLLGAKKNGICRKLWFMPGAAMLLIGALNIIISFKTIKYYGGIYVLNNVLNLLTEAAAMLLLMFWNSKFAEGTLRFKDVPAAPLPTGSQSTYIPVQDTVFCPSCGASMKKGVMFCAACGSPMDLNRGELATPDPVNPNFSVLGSTCPSCGSSLNPGVKFCAACGKAIETKTVSFFDPNTGMDVIGCVENKSADEPVSKPDDRFTVPEDFDDEKTVGFYRAPKPATAPVPEEEMMVCFSCGSIIPVSAQICPNCGVKTVNPEKL